jgi:hypothetical protein
MAHHLKGNTTVLEALQGLRLSLIQQVVLLHLINASRPATFTELLKITDSTPETLTTQMQELYRAGYVRCRSPRGAPTLCTSLFPRRLTGTTSRRKPHSGESLYITPLPPSNQSADWPRCSGENTGKR